MNSPDVARDVDLTQLIYLTMQETINALSKDLDALKAIPDGSYPDEKIETIIDRTQKFVVFVKYSGDYLRHTLPGGPLREEMFKIKLHLLSVLRGLVDKVKVKDRAAVHDLLTEELRDNLTLWKIKILPMLRPAQPSPFGSHQI